MNEYTTNIRKYVAARIELKFGGNSAQTQRDVIVAAIRESGLDYKIIADGSYLGASTVKNYAEWITKDPMSSTTERLSKYFGISWSGEIVRVKPEFRNSPKD